MVYHILHNIKFLCLSVSAYSIMHSNVLAIYSLDDEPKPKPVPQQPPSI